MQTRLALEEFPADGLAAESSGNLVVPSLARLGRTIEILVLVGVTAFLVVQLRPDLLFGSGLDDGGDNAAHVVAVSYFIHNLLSHGALSGWDPQWFDGFPLYVFYFPLPAVLVGALNLVVPYAVAFKLVTVLGAVTLPAAAFVFCRLAGFSAPLPSLSAVAMLVYLFNPSYTIDGGNLPSTLAGEFSFSLAISFGLVFLGVFIRSLRTGRLRALAAVLYAATVLCHVVPALFFAACAIVIALCEPERRRSLRIAAQVLAVGALVAGFWLIRFAADLGYSSSMNYSRVGDLFASLFPHTIELSVQILAGVGALIAVARRERIFVALSLAALLSAVGFDILPSGLVYNARWLPFWFLTTALLGAYALNEIGRLVFFGSLRPVNAIVTPVLVCLLVVSGVAIYLGAFPGYATPTNWQSFIPSWIRWNDSGYQARSGWAEFRDLNSMLVGAAEVDGCGRLDYEYTANAEQYFGSTLAEMSFPYFTNGCIDTTEGVYYESSTTNDFHFLDQSELSVSASNPVVGIPYKSLNVDDGVRHLQLAGVKYFLANSIEVERQAALDPLLKEVDAIPASPSVVEGPTTPATKLRWVLYEVQGVSLVSPLANEPVVESGQSKAQWLKTGIDWYQTPSSWAVEIVRSGLGSWPIATAGTLPTTTETRPLPKTTVSDIKTSNESISFTVSQIGVPVLVKVPFFPNWQAEGAKGPFESTPNMMVVVPSAHHVALRYGTTSTDWIARGGSLVGLALLFVLGLTFDDPKTRHRLHAHRRRGHKSAGPDAFAFYPGIDGSPTPRRSTVVHR